MTRYKYENGILVQLTAKEESERDADEIKCLADIDAEIELKTAKEQKKTSGKQKLLDLGLTEEEVKALIGV
tara:strand:- start:47 stop:259 length:213 start_codon:yes stop_codon:yes gene_type:complete